MTNIGLLKVNLRYGYDRTTGMCLKCGVVPLYIYTHSQWHFKHNDSTPIEELDLPVRFINVLNWYSISTVESLIEEMKNYTSPADWVYDRRNIGFKTGTKVLLELAKQNVLIEGI